jgi:hypothetical protein
MRSGPEGPPRSDTASPRHAASSTRSGHPQAFINSAARFTDLTMFT